MDVQPGEEGSEACERDRLASSNRDTHSGQGDVGESSPAQARPANNSPAPAPRVSRFRRPTKVRGNRRARRKRDAPLSPAKLRTSVKSRILGLANQVMQSGYVLVVRMIHCSTIAVQGMFVLLRS